MTSRHVSRRSYSGLERRSILDRRRGADRRNLVRFEALGSERRIGLYRRYEDLQWDKHLQMKNW